MKGEDKCSRSPAPRSRLREENFKTTQGKNPINGKFRQFILKNDNLYLVVLTKCQALWGYYLILSSQPAYNVVGD